MKYSRNDSFFRWYSKDCLYIDKILMFIVSFILLSSFGVHIFTIGGYYVVELFILLVLIILMIFRKAVYREIIMGVKYPITIIFTIFLFLMLIIGIILGGDAKSSYTDFRAMYIFLYSLIFFLYAKNNLTNKINVLFIISLISSVFSILYPILIVSNSTKTSYPIYSVIILMYLSCIRRSPILLFFSSIIAVYMGITSFYRSYWIIFGMCILFFTTLLFISLKGFFNRKSFFLIVLIIFSLFLSFQIYKSGIITTYLYSSESRYIQSIGKWSELVNSLSDRTNRSESDELRLAYYEFIFDKWPKLLLPHGLGYEAVYGKVDDYFLRFSIPENTIDTSFLYMAYHFGLIITFLGILFILKHIFKKLFFTKGITKVEKSYLILGIAVLTFYGSISGDIFTIIQKAFFAGAFLGILLNKRVNYSLWDK